MPQQVVEIWRGQTDPDLLYTCARSSDSSAVDVTGWTVQLAWAPSDNGTAPSTGASWTFEAMTIDDGTAGEVRYAWPTSDGGEMNWVAGWYVFQVHLTSGAERDIFPAPGEFVAVQCFASAV